MLKNPDKATDDHRHLLKVIADFLQINAYSAGRTPSGSDPGSERRAGALARRHGPPAGGRGPPLDWLADKLHWHSDGGASRPRRRAQSDRGPVMPGGELVRVRVGPGAGGRTALGRSRFRRIEVEGQREAARMCASPSL